MGRKWSDGIRSLFVAHLFVIIRNKEIVYAINNFEDDSDYVVRKVRA